MADDELFGADGTQPLPSPPALADPLGGLVTGYLFSDNTAGPLDPVAEQEIAQATAAAATVRRRVAPGGARRASAPGAMTPDAIPVAEAWSGRQREARRPTVAGRPTTARPTAARPTAVPLAPAVNRRNVAARPASTSAAQAAGRNPAMSRPAPGIQPGRRSAGGGCALFVVVVVLLVVVFVVLGVVLGHGNSGFFGS